MNIHLNDVYPPVMARNVLLLKVISSPEFDEGAGIDYVWDIWYNSEWPETTKQIVCKHLDELINGDHPDYIIFPKRSHLETLREVWSAWRAVLMYNKDSAEKLILQTKHER